MKRKFALVLCMAACIGLIFGCGRKESEDTGYVATIGNAENLPDSPAVDTAVNVSEEESEQNNNIDLETPDSDVDTKISEESTDMAASEDAVAQVAEGQENGETLEETLKGLEFDNYILAIKKGDLFYKIKKDEAMYPVLDDDYGNLPCEDNDNEFWSIRDASEKIHIIDYAQGDELVMFSTVTGFDTWISKVLDASEHYCIPVKFGVNTDGTLDLPMVYAADSYVDGDVDLARIEEYEGTMVKGYYLECIMEGNKDEILEFGGYQGTQYKSVRYKCTGRYYRISLADRNLRDNSENTKDGYAILSSINTNPLESGLYIINGCMMEIKH